MSQIKQLLEGIKPVIEAAKEDITIIPSVQVMMLVRDCLIVEYDMSKTVASRMALSMTVTVADQDDVEDAALILCWGVDLAVLTIVKLAGHLDEDMLLDVCRALSVEG